MKKILIFVFTMIHSIAFAKAELIINIENSKNKEHHTYLKELKILKNGKNYKTLKPQHETEFVLTNLEFGIYTLKYESLFKKEVTIKILITEKKTYSISIYTNFIDYSKENYIPLISKISKGESYSVLLFSKGCAHSRVDSIIINRNENGYTLIHKNIIKKLSIKDIENIKHFEIELNNMNQIGFTTIDTYFLKYKNITTQIYDGSCEWNGLNFLITKIFED
jgi:hypothetical protein